MSPRKRTRTQTCGHGDARTRLVSAEKFLEVARLVEDEATALRRLIERKDKAQYGMVHPSQDDVKSTMRQAERLLVFARGVVER